MHPLTAISSLGFIGTGALTEAVVRGIRSRSDAPTIHLSPRSEAVAASLARELPNVRREACNADVAAKSEMVILAMRPQQLEAALSDVTFRPDHVVVSFVASVSRAEIATLVAPASQVCRVTPLPTFAAGRGPVVLAPALAPVLALFDGVGHLICAETEEQMMAFGCAAGLLSTFFEIEHTVANWLSAAGISSADASLYVRSMFSALAQAGLENQGSTLLELAAAHQTARGLNEHARRLLHEAGLFEQIARALTKLSSLALR